MLYAVDGEEELELGDKVALDQEGGGVQLGADFIREGFRVGKILGTRGGADTVKQPVSVVIDAGNI